MNDKYIIYFISKTKKRMTRFIEQKIKDNGLGALVPSHGNILTVLYESNGTLTMKDIAERIGKDKSTVTPLVNKLVSLGYIQKERCQRDKRVTYIVLTEKGRIIEPKFRDISEDVYTTAYNNITHEEKEVFLKVLKKIYQNFRLNG